MANRFDETFLADRSLHRLTMMAPSAGHRGVDDKYANVVKKVKKIRGKVNVPGIWNVRTGISWEA